MVRRADSNPRKYDAQGAHYDPLPMCHDCTNTSLVRILRADGWANLCVPCYEKHHNGGTPTPKINEWTGPTDTGRAISKQILSQLKIFTGRKPNKDWAKRLLDKHREGQQVPSYALRLALEVAGDAPAPYQTREPGADDE